MKLTKCANGHFYDAEKYPSCPHCSGGSGEKAGDSGEDRKTDCLMPGMGMGGNNNEYDVTMNGADAGFYGRNLNQNVGNERVTVGFNEWQGNRQIPPTPSFGGEKQYNKTAGYGDEENKTVAYMNWQTKDNGSDPMQVTRAAVQQRGGQPVVGWMVCIEGSNYGNCFNLYGGKNFIGRAPEMDICLAGDNTVSRVKHAIIIYEPKERKFFAQPGESHELFYLNDSVVLTSAQIKDRDVITIGKTSLVFVPFCDERYGWVE